MGEARSGSSDFRREYLSRLPLPIAQLYSRAYNAKDARGRHDNSFYVCEALVKLAASVGASAYLADVESGMPRVPALDRLLAQLALPSFGQWLGILREVTRFYGERPDAASLPLGNVWRQLTVRHLDKPSLLELYRRIKNGPDGQPSGDTSISLLELLDSLVQYRNGVFGHGAGRFDSFYEADFGPRLFPAVNELLEDGLFDLLGPRGSRLVYLTEIRKLDDDHFEIRLDELSDRESLRLDPFELNAAEAAGLVPNCVAVRWSVRRVPLRLDPFLTFRGSEQGDEVLFLNRDRNSKQVEYLSYTTGRTERDRTMAPALAGLLSRISHRTVTEDELAAFANQSLTEIPSVEQFFESAPPQGTVRGDFEILAELGRGGMGVVYLARQLSLGRLVALKTLPTDLSGDEVAIARFKREIRSLSRCDDPRVVKLLSSGTFDDNGQAYFAMEYIPGCDLEHVWREVTGQRPAAEVSLLGDSTWRNAVARATQARRESLSRSRIRRPPVNGAEEISATNSADVEQQYIHQFLPPVPPLPDEKETPGGYVRRIVQLIRDAARALQVVHSQQIVHRDVSPANLMVTPNGERLVLMDFGLAKGETQSLLSISGAGLLGKLRYAAPEQMASATIHVGPAADIRGLGVTLWELLSRQRLFGDAADERELAQRVHDEDVPLLRTIDRSIDRDLQAIVARACERSVKDRIPTAERLADYLDLHLEGRPIPIREPTASELVWRWVKRHRGFVSTAATALLLVVATVAVAFTLVKQSETKALELAKDNGNLAVANGELAKSERGEREKAELNLKTARRNLANFHFERGRRFDDLGQPDLALDSYRRLVAIASQDDGGSQVYATVLSHRLTSSGTLLCPPLVHSAIVSSVAFSPDGTRVLTGSVDNTARLWNAQTGAPLGSAMPHNFTSGSASFSPDGTRVLTGSTDKTARLWDAQTGAPLGTAMEHKNMVGPVAFSPDGTRLLMGSSENTARLWDAQMEAPLGTPMVHAEIVFAVAFSLDGTRVLTGSEDKTARLWDAQTGAPLGKAMTHKSWVKSVAFSPDGTRVLTGSYDKTARLWNGQTGAPLGATMEHKGPVLSVAFNPDGTRVLTGSEDTTARLWDAQKGVPLGAAMQHNGPVLLVAFSPDGTRVLTGSEDTTARLWDAQTGAPLGAAMQHNGIVWSVAFSPDGTRVLTGSDDTTARLWDAQTGAPLGTVMEHKGSVGSVAFSSDGTRVLTASVITARLWDAQTGALLGTAMEQYGFVQSAAFSPDGTRVLTVSTDKTARLWDASCYELPAGSRNLDSQSIELWSARRITSDDTATLLTPEQHQMLRRQIGKDDPILEFQQKRQLRLIPARAIHCANAAETNRNWFAASFHLKRLTEFQPDSSDIRHRLGRSLAEQEKWEPAFAAFEEAIKRNANATNFQFDRALVALAEPNPPYFRDSALSLLAHAEQSDSEHDWNNAARLFALRSPDEKQMDRPLVLARKAVKRKNSWEFHGTLGAAFFRTRRFDDAIGELQTAIRLHDQITIDSNAPPAPFPPDNMANKPRTGIFWIHAFLAMAHSALEQNKLANSHRALANEIAADSSGDWQERLTRKLLLQELADRLVPLVDDKDTNDPRD